MKKMKKEREKKKSGGIQVVQEDGPQNGYSINIARYPDARMHMLAAGVLFHHPEANKRKRRTKKMNVNMEVR